MSAPALKYTAGYEILRCKAEQRLRLVRPPEKQPSVQDMRTAMEELHIFDAELQIQNEELLASRAQVEESQKKYFRHFDLAPVGLVRLDHSGLILEANILGAQMLDVNRLQLHALPRTLQAHVAPDSFAVFEQHLEAARASGKRELCELPLHASDGHETFVRLQTVVSRSDTAAEPDFYVTITDLTERREIEQKLELQKVLAEAAVSSKELFFCMLSHELRTPLTPLVALLDDLAKAPGRSADDRAAFAIMRRNLDLETHLIDDLLDVTRITGGKLQLHREIVDVHSSLREAIDICRAEIDGKQLHFTFRPTAARHLVDGDPSRLQQVFWNLIKNAVKFTPQGGRIVIETRCDEAARMTIEVRDTGIGIDSWPLSHIFDPFFQVQPSLKQRGGGLGLGLSICKAIADAHGGTLTADSLGLGQGATFRLELTTVPRPPKKIKQSVVRTPVRARHEGLRVLLAEDHDDTRDVLARLLGRRGYKVSAARDAEEARALAAHGTFDLLVSDMALPDATGCELLTQLNEKYGLRGIAMSGFGSDADLAQSKNAGFLAHLVKPIDAQALDDAIQRGFKDAQESS